MVSRLSESQEVCALHTYQSLNFKGILEFSVSNVEVLGSRLELVATERAVTMLQVLKLVVIGVEQLKHRIVIILNWSFKNH